MYLSHFTSLGCMRERDRERGCVVVCYMCFCTPIFDFFGNFLGFGQFWGKQQCNFNVFYFAFDLVKNRYTCGYSSLHVHRNVS